MLLDRFLVYDLVPVKHAFVCLRADPRDLEAHPFCRLLQYLSAPLKCGALSNVEIWHKSLHDAAPTEHARQGQGHVPNALALRRQHRAGDQRPLVALNSLSYPGKAGADAEPRRVTTAD